MNVSKQFLKDFAYIANRYGWNAADVEEAKEQTRANPAELVPYWTRLAAAHRAGYEQTPENNFMRLGQWLQARGDSGTTPDEAFSLRIAQAREHPEFLESIKRGGETSFRRHRTHAHAHEEGR